MGQRHAKRLPKGMKPIRPGELVQIDTLFVNVAPDKAVKHFTAYDPVAKWSVRPRRRPRNRALRRSPPRQAHRRGPLRIQGIQVDGGSEFRAEFEDACRERNLCLFVLPPKRPQLNGHVERAQGSWRYEFYGVEDLPSRLKPLQLGTGLALPDRMGAPDCARTAETGGGGRRLRVFLLRLLPFAITLGHVELSSARR